MIVKPGQKVAVPRTGGTKSEGQIITIINQGRVLVEFPLGETFRGRKIPEELRGRQDKRSCL